MLLKNPVSTRVEVQMPAGKGPADWALWSVTGQRLLAGRTTETRLIIPLADLPAGAYRLVVQNGRLPPGRWTVVKF